MLLFDRRHEQGVADFVELSWRWSVQGNSDSGTLVKVPCHLKRLGRRKLDMHAAYESSVIRFSGQSGEDSTWSCADIGMSRFGVLIHTFSL
jgi:hypothetical protein